MFMESKIQMIRKTLRNGKKSGLFTGEIETETLSFRYEIYGVRFNKSWHYISLNVRTYDCKYRAWTGSKWYQVGEGWRGTGGINRGIRSELRKEWELFFTSTFDYPTYNFEVGNIKHIK